MTRKCLKCKKRFEPKNGNQVVCSFECARDKAKADREKKEKENYKIERLETAKKKREIEPKSFFEKKLQEQVNKIARLIDYGQNCMMCGREMDKTFGCHFRSVGGHPSLRYNLLQIHIGCFKCNGMEGGNVHGYDERLIEVYGKEFWQYLKFDMMKETPVLQLKRDELEHKTKIAREIVRELEKDLRVRSAEERLMLRKKVNERLCIYIKNA